MEIIICRFCLQKFSVEQSGEYQCPHCRQKQIVALDGSAGAPQGDVSEQGVLMSQGSTPWEQRHQIGFVNGLTETCVYVLKEPVKFFRSLSPQGDSGDALLFGVMVGTLGSLFGFLWQFGWNTIRGGKGVQDSPLPYLDSMFSGGFMWGGIIFLPIFSLLTLLSGAAMVHLFAKIFQISKHDLTATLRVFCYAQPAGLFQVIPLCGAIIAPVWTAILIVMGLREVHETSTGKAILVFFGPLLFCCCVPLGLGACAMALFFKELFKSGGPLF